MKERTDLFYIIERSLWQCEIHILSLFTTWEKVCGLCFTMACQIAFKYSFIYHKRNVLPSALWSLLVKNKKKIMICDLSAYKGEITRGPLDLAG